MCLYWWSALVADREIEFEDDEEEEDEEEEMDTEKVWVISHQLATCVVCIY
jgi:hypothetical protein